MTARPRRRADLPLAAGLVVSLLAHAMLLVPLLTRALGAPGTATELDVHLEPAVSAAPPHITLGIDRSNNSTVTWIGYREYQEHLAPRSTVEQAAFTPAPGAGEVVNHAPAVTPQDAPPTPVPLPVPVPVSATASSEFREPAPPMPVAVVAPAQPVAAQPVPVPSMPVQHAPPLVATAPLPLSLPPDRSDAPGKSEPPGKSTPRDAPPPAPQVPAPPALPAAPAAPLGTPGDRADMESDATSLVEVPFDRLHAGKPLAAQGLQIRTRRPEFTTLLRLTAAPGNPLVEIRFGADGSPESVALLRSSGDVRIDDAIISSLFRWRAAGETLDRLAEGETADVRIRILLSRREAP